MDSRWKGLPLRTARSLVSKTSAPVAGFFDLNRLRGRLVEVSEPASWGALSLVAEFMVRVQGGGEQIVWISVRDTVFFPPDLASIGLNLNGLCVIRSSSLKASLQATEWLLQSQSFGLLVVDGVSGRVDEGTLGRLAKLVDQAQGVLLFLTNKKASDASLGAMVSLRGAIVIVEGLVAIEVVRDKHPVAAPSQRNRLRGPLGLY